MLVPLKDSSGNANDGEYVNSQGTYDMLDSLQFQVTGAVTGDFGVNATLATSGTAFAVGEVRLPNNSAAAFTGSFWLNGWAYFNQTYELGHEIIIYATGNIPIVTFTCDCVGTGGLDPLGEGSLSGFRRYDSSPSNSDQPDSGFVPLHNGIHMYSMVYNSGSDTFFFYLDGVSQVGRSPFNGPAGSGHPTSTAPVPFRAILDAGVSFLPQVAAIEILEDEIAFGSGAPSSGTMASLYAAGGNSTTYNSIIAGMSPLGVYHLNDPYLPTSPWTVSLTTVRGKATARETKRSMNSLDAKPLVVPRVKTLAVPRTTATAGTSGGSGPVFPTYNAYARAVIADTPNVYWTLDESSLAGVNDASGHGNIGVCSGDYKRNQVQIFPLLEASYVTPDHGSAVSTTLLGGTTSQIKSSVTFPNGLYSAWSFEGIILLPTTSAINHTLFAIEDPAGFHGTVDRLRIELQKNTSISSFISWVVGSTSTSFSLSVAAGSFFHLAVTYNGTNVKVYTNGTLRVTSGTVSGGTTFTGNPEFKFGNGASGPINVLASDVAWYTYALTATQVTAHNTVLNA